MATMVTSSFAVGIKRKFADTEDLEDATPTLSTGLSSSFSSLTSTPVGSSESEAGETQSETNPYLSLFSDVFVALLEDEEMCHVDREVAARVGGIPEASDFVVLMAFMAAAASRLCITQTALHVAAGILTRCLGRVVVQVSRQKAVVLACLGLAAKFADTKAPQTTALLGLLAEVITPSTFFDIERKVLVVTEYSLSLPTVLDFLPHVSQHVSCGAGVEGEVLAYVVDVSLECVELVFHLVSERAVACVAVAHAVLHGTAPADTSSATLALDAFLEQRHASTRRHTGGSRGEHYRATTAAERYYQSRKTSHP